MNVGMRGLSTGASSNLSRAYQTERGTMNRNGSKKTARRVRVWSYDEAKKAVPYISAIMRSLREHCLESQSHKRSAQRLADKPGRPDRTALVIHTEEVREATEAQNRFD